MSETAPDINQIYLKIAVNAPLAEPLTYLVPDSSYAEQAKPLRGQSVKVPLASRSTSGIVLGFVEVAEAKKQAQEFTIKAIDRWHEDRPALPEPHLLWLEWLAKYYLYPVGQVMEMAFAPLKSKGKVRKTNSVVPNQPRTDPPPLMPEQAEAIKAILSRRGFAVNLLFGVTGSGKTEVYLRLIAETLAGGEQALVLVPEIALTPQLIQRFSSRFGEQVAVIHSHLTPRERTEQWWNVVQQNKQILIGARSALFCPIPRLGLIVIDEEHEPSFKQDESLKYHARDAAVMLAKFRGCPIVLGSATPSLESWQNALSGRYYMQCLSQRVAGRSLPTIEIVDMRLEQQAKKNSTPASPAALAERPFWLSEPLQRALTETLDRGEQAALFLNRRGVAATILCQECGHIQKCPNCDISLTLHAQTYLVCHYCGYHENLKPNCSTCGVGEVKLLGMGTERLELDLAQLFPQARIARADRDEIQTREHLEELIAQMERHEIDILVGTQMIAKGLDFPKLNLVGLVLADLGFNMPDFRSSERSFHLMTQVGGRAGRHVEGDERGRVLLQTYNPEHPAIQFAMQHDYEGFAEQELAARRELGYPPFGRIASLRLIGPEESEVRKAAERVRREALGLTQRLALHNSLQVLGPVPAPLFKLRNKYRYHLLLKAHHAHVLGQFCASLNRQTSKILKRVRLQFDIDPINMM